MRISAEQLYVQAGLLEDRGSSLAVEAAVLSDPSINERQKRVLLDIYASFLSENGVDGGASTAATAAPKTTKKATRRTAKKATRRTAKKAAKKTSATKPPAKKRATKKSTAKKTTAKKSTTKKSPSTDKTSAG